MSLFLSTGPTTVILEGLGIANSHTRICSSNGNLLNCENPGDSSSVKALVEDATCVFVVEEQKRVEDVPVVVLLLSPSLRSCGSIGGVPDVVAIRDSFSSSEALVDDAIVFGMTNTG